MSAATVTTWWSGNSKPHTSTFLPSAMEQIGPTVACLMSLQFPCRIRITGPDGHVLIIQREVSSC